uniref:Uncharacterized protein n=1 Tax=Candidatus Kentrum sp. SD TaxID=2126332 RepID=A0A450YDJ6_9GAMM|nr:MAG: hypothetical protein BECKSD772F_GA0070984_104417 [Candidatus Kentron sp. SD]VFK80882.1 MAG: hypothetical protein BECKSD772D_GA0070982_11725 [Candidatus Kentron sp. SD]
MSNAKGIPFIQKEPVDEPFGPAFALRDAWIARANNIPVGHRLTTLSGFSPTGSTEPTTIRNFICQKNRFANQTTKVHPVPLIVGRWKYS